MWFQYKSKTACLSLAGGAIVPAGGSIYESAIKDSFGMEDLGMCRFIFTVSSLVFLLTGCAGSPVQTSSLSPQQLLYIDNFTLCKAYTPREYYQPSAAVVYEVRRRGLNCAEIYQWNGTPGLDAAAEALRGVTGTSAAVSPEPTRPVAFKKAEYQSGFNKICIYSRLGSDEAYTFKATDICPASIP